MKPLALALAVTVLGSGCIVVDDDGPAPCTSNLAVDWEFQLADGSFAGCSTADVQWVDVYVDGAAGERFSCASGGATVWAPSGSVVTVEGIDAANRIAYRDWITAPTGCGTRYASVLPSEGTANLVYTYEQPGCVASPCYLWFAVWDEIAGEWAAVIDQGSSLAVKTAFPYPGPVAIRLATGSYSLEWMELVSSVAASPATGEQMTCVATAFDVGAALETVVPVTLDPVCVPQ